MVRNAAKTGKFFFKKREKLDAQCSHGEKLHDKDSNSETAAVLLRMGRGYPAKPKYIYK